MPCQDSQCIVIRGAKSECHNARIVNELIVRLNSQGDIRGMEYVLSDGKKVKFARNEESLTKARYILYEVIAASLIEMLNGSVNDEDRVKLTCNGVHDMSIPDFLTRLGCTVHAIPIYA